MIALALLACSSPSDLIPVWGFDPVYLEPEGTGVYGFHTWNLYGEAWAEDRDEKHFVCAVVSELTGTPAEPCEDCTLAWDLFATVLETDCTDTVAQDPLFTSISGIGIGAENVVQAAPYPGFTFVGHVNYGAGWEVHGDAWPAALDGGGTAESPEWDGVQAFTFWPTAIWPLDSGGTAPTSPTTPTPATTAPVSRLASPVAQPRR